MKVFAILERSLNYDDERYSVNDGYTIISIHSTKEKTVPVVEKLKTQFKKTYSPSEFYHFQEFLEYDKKYGWKALDDTWNNKNLKNRGDEDPLDFFFEIREIEVK